MTDPSPDAEAGLAALLGGLGVRLFEFDAERRLERLVPPATPSAGGLIGADVRSLVDPLVALSAHPEVARAVADRVPFRDLLVPIHVGGTTRMMRISGMPRHDADGAYRGYRGVAVDAGPARPAEAEIPAPLRQGLTQALGLIIGFGRFLQQEMSTDRPGSDYLARLLAAAGVARNIVEAAAGSPMPAAAPPADAEAPAAGRLGRVLLVHETPVIADLIAVALDRAGFETGVCRDAAEAVEVLLDDTVAWDVLVTTARNALQAGASLIPTARGVRPATLCVVCDEPDQAALVEADADICWVWPVEAAGLTRLLRAQLQTIGTTSGSEASPNGPPNDRPSRRRRRGRRIADRDSYPAAPPSYPSAPV